VFVRSAQHVKAKRFVILKASDNLPQQEGDKMTDPQSPLSSALRAVNFGSSGIDKIKLGSGVVGKLAATQMGLYVVCFAALVAGAVMQNPIMVFSSLGVAACGYVFGSLSSMIFAARHPDLALLEGAELVSFRQIEMAAKSIPIPPSQPNTAPPSLPPTEGTP
jgi:hypothetical protein